MKRGGPLRRTPIRGVSKKRQRDNALRTKVMAHVREFQDWCSRCGQTGVGLDAHELKSRAQGGSIVDLENVILACRPCHQWITENPREAAEQGWAISRKWGAA
jgi:5-methylcytosine-specific restriction endonuclease McrA